MSERILSVLVFVALFVAFGLMTRRIGHRGCHDCGGSCGSGTGDGCGVDSAGAPSTDYGVGADASEEKNPAGWWG